MSGVEAENGTGPAEEADAGGAPSPKRRALKLGPLKPLPAQDKERIARRYAKSPGRRKAGAAETEHVDLSAPAQAPPPAPAPVPAPAAPPAVKKHALELLAERENRQPTQAEQVIIDRDKSYDQFFGGGVRKVLVRAHEKPLEMVQAEMKKKTDDFVQNHNRQPYLADIASDTDWKHIWERLDVLTSHYPVSAIVGSAHSHSVPALKRKFQDICKGEDHMTLLHLTRAIEASLAQKDGDKEAKSQPADTDETKLLNTMVFLCGAGAHAQAPINATQFVRACRQQATTQRIVTFWRRAKARRAAVQAVELCKKWINYPKEDQMCRFLALTNGTAGKWVPLGSDTANKNTNMSTAKQQSQLKRAYAFKPSNELLETHAKSARKGPSHRISKVLPMDAAADSPLKMPWCGKFAAEGESRDVPYLTVDITGDGYNPHLIRFYMEHVWKLKRPDVIISVTGGAEDFDLSTEELDRIFKAMMDGTRSLDAWFVTGGTNAGVMRCMGEFRAKYNPTAPLIGVASLGVINGSERLRGIDTTNCPKEADKKGWQKFGFTHERLPPLSDEDVVGTRISKLEDEIAYDEHRIKVLKEFERSKKASEKLLAPSLKFLQERRDRLCQDRDAEKVTRQKFDDFKQTHVPPSHPNTFREFQEIGETSKKQRAARSVPQSFVPQIALDPNHSHFIFADDGSLNFGTDAKLRADVESCVAGVFKGVGVKQTGAGGKILQKIDDEITKMLVETVKLGWENADMPLPPQVKKDNRRTDRQINRCTDCRRFIWGPPVEYQGMMVQAKCEICLRNDAIKGKLQNFTWSPFEAVPPRVNVRALKHATSSQQKIKWEPKALETERAALESFKSKECLDSDPDMYEKAQKVQHHKWFVELLELYESGATCFEVVHEDEMLGYFKGSLPDLVMLIKEVQIDIARKMHKPPSGTKKEEGPVDRVLSSERPVPHEVPMVCVCVEGGPGTINTVLSAAKNGTACLLVKGSGRAACLISDAVLLRDLKTTPKVLDHQQEAMLAFLHNSMGMRRDPKTGLFDYRELSNRLGRSQKVLEAWHKKEHDGTDWNDFRAQYCQEWSRAKKDDPTLSEALRIEWRAAVLVQKQYITNPAATRFCITQKLQSAFQAAATGMCKVFKLHTTEPNAKSFKDSLLECMLNGICDPEDDNQDALANKVKYSIIWECADTLREVLHETGLNSQKKVKATVLKDALIDAIARNNVPAVKVLFEDLCVSMDQFDVSFRLRKTKDVLNMATIGDLEPSMVKYIESGDSWSKLLSRIKQGSGSSGGHGHVDVLKSEIKKANASNDSRLTKAKSSKKDAKDNFEKILTDSSFNQSQVQLVNAATNASDSYLISKHERKLLLLEAIYADLLGEDFCYHIGCMSPEMDLFFLNVLYNRMEMADIFWQRSPVPIMSAISAAYMLRQMAKSDGVEPASRILMLENAFIFEEKAVGVMKMAQKTDRAFATLALDCNLRLWMDMTLLDLSVQSSCGLFVEECCREAIDARMYGDIDPYNNSLWWIAFNVFPLFGLCSAIGKWFARLDEWAIKFKLPPVDNVVRASTQRRLAPEGYPNRPNENDVLKEPPHNCDVPRVGDESKRELADLWDPTFSSWERFMLFWKAPIVIYICNILLAWTNTIIFSYYFILYSPILENPPDDKKAVGWYEIIIAVYYGCVLVREILQLILEGEVLSYFGDFWNIIDWVAVICFYWGFYVNHAPSYTDPRFMGFLNTALFATDENSPFKWGHHTGENLYCLSIFCMYMKLLRSFALFRRLAIIVKIFLKMTIDVIYFLVVYLLFLFAFSIVMVGAGRPDSILNKCHVEIDGRRKAKAVPSDGDLGGQESETTTETGYHYSIGAADTEDYHYVECWRSWWFFRTLFQSFGELFLDEMTNDWAVMWMILIFLVMNVVLMNLLIAIMSNTYEKVQEQVLLQNMLDLYSITIENSKYATALPPPLNVFGLILELCGFAAQYKRIQDHWPKAPLLKRFGLYLSRNSDHFIYREWFSLLEEKETRTEELSETAKSQALRLSMFAENARKDYLLLVEEAADNRVENLVSHMHETVVQVLESKIDDKLQKLQDKLEQFLPADKAGFQEEEQEVDSKYAVCGYLTDVEANFDYFERYLKISQIIGWSDEDSVFVPKLKKLEFKRDDAIFVYGGDTQDKGIGDIRFTKLLLELRENYPGRVEFIIGNRDANKLRFATELHPDTIADERVIRDTSFPYWENEGKRCTPQMFLEKNPPEKGGSANTAANRLRWILEKNMGAVGAFDRRRHELSILRECDQADVSDEDVVESYRDEVDPRKHPGLKWEEVGSEKPDSGKLIEHSNLSAQLQAGRREFSVEDFDALRLPSDDLSYISYSNYIKAGDVYFKPAKQHGNNFMLQFLKEAKLAYVFGPNLFVHGAINADNQGTVPGAKERLTKVHDWVNALNAWCQKEVQEFEADPFYHAESTDDFNGLYTDRRGGDLMDYGVPNGNEGKTVVYNHYLDEKKKNNAKHIAREVQEFLTASHIVNVVSGHQPHGDCPCIIRTGPVTVITADTSYSEMGHKSEWGADNRGVNAISEVLLYADGTSEVHGFLADGSPIAYKLGAAGDAYVGHQLGNGFWVKAKVVGPEPEYVLAMMQGFAYITERKRVWEMDALTAAHFNIQQCHDTGLAQAGIDSALHGILINAGLDIETLRMAADDRRYLASELEKAGIRRPGDRVRIVKAVMQPNL